LRRNKPTTRKSTPRRSVGRRSSAALTGITPAEVLEPLLWLLDAVGVSRREVLAIVRSLPPVKLPVPVTVVRGQLEYWSHPLVRWAADTRFLGPDGRPRDLAFVAGDPSFSDLVAIALPGERPAACRDTLLAIGAIIRLPNGQLRWRDRTVAATGAESGVLLADEYLRPLRSLLLVLQTNLLRRPGVPNSFQMAVSGFEISREDMVEFDRFVVRHGTAFLENVDDWLSHRQLERQQSGHTSARRVRPYVGLYLGTDSDNAQFALRAPKPRVRLKGSGKKPHRNRRPE
jgi:Family of unknown function (DUF6502)